MTSEFDLIRRYFTRPASRTVLGVGDDAALVRVAAGRELAVSTDMLLAGRHFLFEDDPFALGHKALAVNLSDMAAMGATPRWALLSIALPEVNERWLSRFTEGWFALADQQGVALIGGDTTKGPLTLSVTIMGEVAKGQALRRSGAKVGDEIWVSGTLGDAALALAYLQRRIQIAPHDAAVLLPRLHAPTPQVKLGQKLLGLAHSAIDISDGLLADLGHILELSGVGAQICVAALPVSENVRGYLHDEVARNAVLAGGDDYELCFTAPAKQHDAIVRMGRRLKLPLTCIGEITRQRKLVVLDENNHPLTLKEQGFDHFA
ncbi:MAG: thiamine-phosphate kinase [Betaproteobacteria bacterium RBG_16_58_11]|nr:MAG: thiamine-phosphate kinase [Betaproteobacteria bacterium RBG_16_58_11]OFZ94706.1 MAG: thiamine-phosphate kinase [Betaproteobacteria bacterium RBG_19FT_COMBO_58_11]